MIDQFSLIDTKKRIKTLISTINSLPGKWTSEIINEIIIPEFRELYTPELDHPEDRKIFVKENIFKFKHKDSYETIPFYIIKMRVETHNNHYRVSDGEIMSLAEFLYSYCNPEGIKLLEKIQICIVNENWTDRQEKLNNGQFDEEEYEVPF
jgi:hypothetical protein